MQSVLDWLLTFWRESAPVMQKMYLVFVCGLAIEYFFRAEKNQPLRDIGFNLVYAFFYVIFNKLLFELLFVVHNPVVNYLGGPLMILHFGDAWWSQLLHVLLFLFIFDFFYYWFHRLQHESRYLWQQHELHHSERSLNVTTGGRHHWMEDSMRIFVILIPMSFLIRLDAEKVGLIWATFMLWGYFIHLNIRLDMKFLTPVFGGPQYHRIHHSREGKHWNKNYAAFFPIYDIVFGSYYRPGKGEYPKTGLLGKGENMNYLSTALFSPFVNWYRMLKRGFKSNNKSTKGIK
ncbi:sterol desaturase family protein [Marinicella sp. W31]|uniref:sterol desaturase family protein n=1 Tax=Marinicella sp. W31 TaxID=3023713 RepID=UPI0037576FD6